MQHGKKKSLQLRNVFLLLLFLYLMFVFLSVSLNTNEEVTGWTGLYLSSGCF